MAGHGTRLRPHTLTTPKPLIKINGKTIIERLIEGLAKNFNTPIDKIAFVTGNFGKEVEEKLKNIARNQNAEPLIFHQKEALGTAHAVYCAAEAMNDEIIVAFADTLFYANFKISQEQPNIIWTQKVENPEQFGVVTTNQNNEVTDFVEKPKTFVSDKAIIGIYYFKKGEILRNEIKNIIDNDLMVSGEYQLTDALQNMKKNNEIFLTANVEKWLDCGNSKAVINTSKEILRKEGHYQSSDIEVKNSQIIEPCYIAKNVKIENSVIGPFVAIDENSYIKNSVISNSIIGENNNIQNVNTTDTMLGNNVEIIKKQTQYDLGSYSKIY